MKEFVGWMNATVGTYATMRQATVLSKGRQFLQDLLDFYLSPLFSTTPSTQGDRGIAPFASSLFEFAIPRSVSSRGEHLSKSDIHRLLPYPISL